VSYQDFKSHFEPFQAFSITDILKWNPDFDSRRLVEWQAKGYVRKIINKWYCFTTLSIDEPVLFLIANRICSPSYISFESALSYYGFIPEGVLTVHSATSLKTKVYSTALGHFNYRNLKPSLMFGIRMIKAGNQQVRLAEPEKALLDYLYLKPRFNKDEDFDELRLNRQVCKEKIDVQKLTDETKFMKNQALTRRVTAWLNWLSHA
jgi:predicted transcriptional regulator of viral defense system